MGRHLQGLSRSIELKVDRRVSLVIRTPDQVRGLHHFLTFPPARPAVRDGQLPRRPAARDEAFLPACARNILRLVHSVKRSIAPR